MALIDLAEAQKKLDELIDRVARGETVDITRDGKLVAQLTPPPIWPSETITEKKPIDFERLRRLRANMPPQTEDAGEFMRRVRDNERY